MGRQDCRIYVLHDSRRQVGDDQGPHRGPQARELQSQRAAICARLQPAAHPGQLTQSAPVLILGANVGRGALGCLLERRPHGLVRGLVAESHPPFRASGQVCGRDESQGGLELALHSGLPCGFAGWAGPL